MRGLVALLVDEREIGVEERVVRILLAAAEAGCGIRGVAVTGDEDERAGGLPALHAPPELGQRRPRVRDEMLVLRVADGERRVALLAAPHAVPAPIGTRPQHDRDAFPVARVVVAGHAHPARPRPTADGSADRRRVPREVPPVVDVDAVRPILVDHVVVVGAARPPAPLAREVGDLDEVRRAVEGGGPPHPLALVTAAGADAAGPCRILDVERESRLPPVEQEVRAHEPGQLRVLGVLLDRGRQGSGLLVVLRR